MTDSSTHKDILTAAKLPADEQLLLDTALQESDQLLARSLQDDQRRRARRWLWVLLIGGVAMLTLVLVILFGGLTLGLPGVADAKPTRAETERAEALAAEGWQLWQRREMTAAAKKFEEATRLTPEDANAWNGFGWALFNSGQSTKAKRAFEKCVKLEPTHPAGLNGLGQLYLDRGEYEHAEQYLKKAAKNPQASAAWYGLSRLYLLTGKFKTALPWAEKAAAASPQDTYSQQMLAAAKAGELSEELRSLLSPAAANDAETEADKEAEIATATPPADLAECLEDLRRVAVAYDLSFDQVLEDELSPHDEGRLELFPSKDAWPDMLGYVERESSAYRTVAGKRRE